MCQHPQPCNLSIVQELCSPWHCAWAWLAWKTAWKRRQMMISPGTPVRGILLFLPSCTGIISICHHTHLSKNVPGILLLLPFCVGIISIRHHTHLSKMWFLEDQTHVPALTRQTLYQLSYGSRPQGSSLKPLLPLPHSDNDQLLFQDTAFSISSASRCFVFLK